MKIEKIKPLVSEYAANLSMLFVTPLSDEVKQYITFFNFLFRKTNFYMQESEDAYEIWKKYATSIDFIIIHINQNVVEEYKELIQKIRKDDDNIRILILLESNAQTREKFTTSSCYCADGFLPSPFEKDELYKYLYRFLKRIAERKELEEYVKHLESAQAMELFPETTKLMQAEALSETQELQSETSNNIKVREDIRFNHGYKMSAHELMEELDSTIVDKAEDFLTSLEDYSVVLYNMQDMDGKTAIAQIDSIVDTLSTFSYIIDTLSTFPVIVRAFNDLVNFLKSLSVEQLDDYEKKVLLLEILTGLGHDLESWIINIFHEQSTDDIHYLDASFANNTLELEALFNNVSIESDEDDLEFF